MEKAKTAAPLLQALDEFNQREYAYFAIPGHRYERGMPSALADRFGGGVYRYDLTESVGLDDLHNAAGAIKEAQEAAAKLFGADECRFSVNGTTALIEAMILAAAGPGEEIVIARDAHRCAVSGLILSGARPVWLMPETDEKWKITGGISPQRVRETLTEHPDAKAVLIVSPTYYGQACDAAAIADICHEHGIPLLVDAAHGTHFPFSNAYPVDSILSGADLTAMSFHKTAGSMTQSSMLFYKDTRRALFADDPETDQPEADDGNPAAPAPFIDMSAIDAALRMTISSSPSYVLMASLDAARQQLEEHGEEEADEAIRKALDLRRALQEIPGVRVRGGSDILSALQGNMDVTRVVFSVTGIRGTEVRDRLSYEETVAVEMADAENVVAVVTAANTDREILQLSMAVFKISASAAGSSGNGSQDRPEQPDLPEAAYLPREAFFAEKERIPFAQSAGRIAAEIICPYPPGIPLLVPGEKISGGMVRYLTELRNSGIPVQGLPEDGTIRVLRKTEQNGRQISSGQ